MKVAIIVLNWNGEKYISSCLDSLKKLHPAGHAIEVVIVDNGSTDNSVSLVSRNYPRFTLIKTGGNLGYAGGNNVGLKYALDNSFDYIWIVNPDIQVDQDSLKYLISSGQNHPRAGILGPKMYFTPGFESHKERYTKKDLGKVIFYAGGSVDWANVYSLHHGINEVDTGQLNEETETRFIAGAAMLVKAQVLRDIGILDEKYFLYYEENDLCQRALKAGWKLWFVPQSIVWHADAQATGLGSPLQDYYIIRNRMLFGMRYAPLRSKIALIKESFRLLYSGRPWQKRGIVDFYLGRFGPGSYVNRHNHH